MDAPGTTSPQLTPEEFKQLCDLCRVGKLYDVEKWIAQGKPVNGQPHRHTSPLLIAIDKGFHSLVELLVKNGADLSGKINPLQRAVARQNPDIVELLIRYGANVRSVDFAYVCRFGPHPRTLRLFMDNGADFRTGYPIAHAFQEGIRTMLGLYKTYVGQYAEIQKQADMALRYHCEEGNMGWVCRLLWAGANPRAKVLRTNDEEDPELEATALECAASSGHCDVVKKIVDPAKDDLDQLLCDACFGHSPELIKYLIELGANPNGRRQDGSTPLSKLFLAFSWYSDHTFSRTGYHDEGQIDRCMEEMFARGAKWEPTDGYELSLVRRALYNKWADSILSFIRMLKHHEACSDEMLVQLVNTGRMRWILREHDRELFKLLPQLKDRAVPQWGKPRKKRRSSPAM